MKLFISSVQSEFAHERQALRDFIRGEKLLGRHFEVFLFEDQPAQDCSPVDLYLDEVDDSTVYLALLGARYGFEDSEGVSPTEREFDRAVERRKHRLVFLRRMSVDAREAKQARFVAKVESQVVRRAFDEVGDLCGEVYDSLLKVLEDERVITERPFDARAPSDANIDSVDGDKVRAFIDRADEARRFTLKRTTSTADALRHLNLMNDGRPSNSALLLFGVNPREYAPAAETKCLHYAGTEPRRPALSYQVFQGTIFEQIDAATGFVMAKLARSVGVRDQGPQAPVEYEIPQPAVAEAVVNALAHRDYTAASAVQVSVFSDRVEVSNPGELPRGLTPDQLREAHPSIPRNPLICEALFLTKYIEKAGTGTLDMIGHCRDAGLPEPGFRQAGDQWVVTLWRRWLTPAFIAMHGLNSRQVRGLEVLAAAGRLTRSAYREGADVPVRTATRDLDDLVQKGLVRLVGEGRGAHYVRAENGP